MNKAIKRYNIELTLSMVICYPAALFLANWLAEQFDPGLPWIAGIAFLPVLPGIWALFAVFRMVRSLDELQRRIQLEAATFSLVVTMLVTLTYGFMQDFLHLPQIGLYWITTLMIACWSIGGAVARRKYA
ncbi:MAG TPA: hypothetical protein VFK45_05305 [Gammaproteobacteria bacterium]|nr:hypothetical protein [Gammaproteobacteria bacterium]